MDFKLLFFVQFLKIYLTSKIEIFGWDPLKAQPKIGINPTKVVSDLISVSNF